MNMSLKSFSNSSNSTYGEGVIASLRRISTKFYRCFGIPLQKIVSFFRFFREFSSYSHNYGGILIEFAFSIPILIILLLFTHDHYHYYELKNKIKSSAASMLQQIGNTKTDKQLHKEDFGRISYASCLNLFHTNSMFSPWSLKMYYVVACYCVKRISSNSYKFQHCFGSTSRGSTPSEMFQQCGSVLTRTSDQVKKMHKDLICDKDDEERVVIECIYREAGKNLGFFILKPNVSKVALDGYAGNAFIYYLVITPKPGLFPGIN